METCDIDGVRMHYIHPDSTNLFELLHSRKYLPTKLLVALPVFHLNWFNLFESVVCYM